MTKTPYTPELTLMQKAGDKVRFFNVMKAIPQHLVVDIFRKIAPALFNHIVTLYGFLLQNLRVNMVE